MKIGIVFQIVVKGYRFVRLWGWKYESTFEGKISDNAVPGVGSRLTFVKGGVVFRVVEHLHVPGEQVWLENDVSRPVVLTPVIVCVNEKRNHPGVSEEDGWKIMMKTEANAFIVC